MKLTKFTRGHETWGDLVRHVASGYGVDHLTDMHVDFILWERTPWPFGGRAETEAALHRHFGAPEEDTQ